MIALEELRTEMRINGELTEIVDALKVIAVTEFWSLDEKRKARSLFFLNAFQGFFQMIDFSATEHPFAKDSTGRAGVVLLTSDERFMGGLNKRIVDTGLAYPGADRASLAVVGTQGADYLRSLKREFTPIEGVTSKKPYEAALLVRDFILTMVTDQQLGRLTVVYPKPLSFLYQTVEALPLLPCTELLFLEKRELQKRETILGVSDDEVLNDSSLEDIVEYLVRMWLAEKLLEVFEDSRQAELSAKAVRLEESYQTLLEGRKKLVHQYHRTHHEVLDKGMRETFSSKIKRGQSVVKEDEEATDELLNIAKRR